MTNQMVTIRPNSTLQLGSWTVVGAANAHTALSDNLDTSYVQLVTRCNNDPQLLKVGFPAPSIPSNAKIFSVGTRIRIQVKVPPDPPPFGFCWHRCRHSLIDLILGLIFFFLRFLFCSFRCPKGPTVIWVTQDLGVSTTNPDGQEWTLNDFNSQFDVQLGRDDTNSNPHRISEVYVDVYYNVPPTVTVTAPTGTNSANCRPSVTWVYADTESDRQDKYLVRLFNSAQYSAAGFDPTVSTALAESGWTSGEDLTWQIPLDLVNDTYRAYVTVQQVWNGLSVSRSGGTDFTQWTQSVVGAPVPIMLSAVFEPDLNRVKLQVEPSSGSPVTVSYTIETSQDAGITWSNVRNGVQINADGMNPVTLYDYEAPLNKLVKYRALAFRQVGSLRFVSAGYSNVVSATPVSEQFWLKDPLDPSLNSIFPIAYLGDAVTRQKAQGVFSVIAGRSQANKVAVTGPQYGVEGTFQLVFSERDAQDYWAAFKALDGTGRTLLLQYPNGEQHYLVFGPGTTGDDMQWIWDMSMYTNKYRYYKVQVSYTEVDKPPIT